MPPFPLGKVAGNGVETAAGRSPGRILGDQQSRARRMCWTTVSKGRSVAIRDGPSQTGWEVTAAAKSSNHGESPREPRATIRDRHASNGGGSRWMTLRREGAILLRRPVHRWGTASSGPHPPTRRTRRAALQVGAGKGGGPGIFQGPQGRPVAGGAVGLAAGDPLGAGGREDEAGGGGVLVDQHGVGDQRAQAGAGGALAHPRWAAKDCEPGRRRARPGRPQHGLDRGQGVWSGFGVSAAKSSYIRHADSISALRRPGGQEGPGRRAAVKSRAARIKAKAGTSRSRIQAVREWLDSTKRPGRPVSRVRR